MGKTMPMRPLVRTLRAQQAAKAQQRSGLTALSGPTFAMTAGWDRLTASSSRGRG